MPDSRIPRSWLLPAFLSISRSAHRISQRQLAAQTGLSSGYVAQIERLDSVAGKPGKKAIYHLAEALYVPAIARDPNTFGDILWNAIWAPTPPRSLARALDMIREDYFTIISQFATNPAPMAHALGLPHPPILAATLPVKRTWLWMILESLENMPDACFVEIEYTSGTDHFQNMFLELEELESEPIVRSIECKRRTLHGEPPPPIINEEKSVEWDILSAWRRLTPEDQNALRYMIQRLLHE